MFFSRWFDPRLSCLALLPRLESTVAFIPPLLKTEPIMANMGSNFATNKSEKEKKENIKVCNANFKAFNELLL